MVCTIVGHYQYQKASQIVQAGRFTGSKYIFGAASCNSHFHLFFCVRISKPHPVTCIMGSMLANHPLRAAPVASDCNDTYLRKLLIQIGNGSAEAVLATEWGEEEFWEVAVAD